MSTQDETDQITGQMSKTYGERTYGMLTVVELRNYTTNGGELPFPRLSIAQLLDHISQLEAGNAQLSSAVEQWEQGHESYRAELRRIHGEQLKKAWAERDAERAHNARLREALEFYAKHEHWMNIHENALYSHVLIANGKLSTGNGWDEAAAVLAETQEGHSGKDR